MHVLLPHRIHRADELMPMYLHRMLLQSGTVFLLFLMVLLAIGVLFLTPGAP
jgi:hypothetical protein